MDSLLVLAKVDEIDNIIKQFNSFDKSIKLTVDTFEDGVVHFLDIKNNGCETDSCYKTINTGQYCDFSSQKPCMIAL